MDQVEKIYYVEPVPPEIHLFWRQRVRRNFKRVNIYSGNGADLKPDNNVRILDKTYRIYDEISSFGFNDIPYPVSAETVITFTELIGKRVLLIVNHNTKL